MTFWYGYIKQKYWDKARLCYMYTDSFIIHIKTEEFYKDISNDVENRFDTSKYDEKDKRPLPIGKNKKAIGIFKDELGGKIMKQAVGLTAKAYAYLIDDSEHKKAKGTKKCIIKRELTFTKSQQIFKSDHHSVYTVELNKIALNSNDDKRLRTIDKGTTYSCGTNAFNVCESEMLSKIYKQ